MAQITRLLELSSAGLVQGRDLTDVSDELVVNELRVGGVAGTVINTTLLSSFIKSDGTVAMAANLDMGSNKIVNVTDPTSAQDAATKAYVDSQATSVSAKAAVVVAADSNVVIASGLGNGDIIDGVTLATGDRVLLFGQSVSSENGIYDVVASGAGVRSSDSDAAAELNNSWVAVEGGTYAGHVLVQTATIATLGSDAVTFKRAEIVGGDMVTATLSAGDVTIAVDLASVSGLESSNSGDPAGQLRVKLEAANPTLQIDGSNQLGVKLDAAGAVVTGASGVAANVDNSTVEISSNALQLKDDGITNAKINSAAAIDESKLNLDFSTASLNTAIGLRALDADVIKKDGSVAFTGDQSMGSNKITSVADPTNPQDAATKAYVDSVAAGLDPKESVRLATAAALPAVTAAGSGIGKTLTANAVGALSVDGVAVALNDRILVKNQASAVDNGIYTVTTLGDGSTAFVLTRATDFDGTPSNEVSGGAFAFVEVGSTLSSSGWVVSADGNVVVDTDSISFTQFSGAGSFTADGEGIELTGTVFGLELDGATLSKSGSGLKVADSGVDTTQLANNAVTADKIAAAVAGDGLAGGGGSALSVNVDNTTIEISTDTLQVKDSGISTAKIAADAVDKTKIAADVAGSGLSQAAGGELDVDSAPAIVKSMVMGEGIGTLNTSFVVRLSVNGETAGRIHRASGSTAPADRFYAVGIILVTSALSAGDSADVHMHGSFSLGASDPSFAAADIGKPVFLSATTAGAFSTTAPTGSGQAVVRIGMVETTTSILLHPPQVVGLV